jgi:predicted DNA-binding ribbon-helix-helix protein
MKSSVVKRSVIVGKHKTSVSLEDAFWTSLKEIAASRRITCSALLSELNEHSAIRQFVLHHYQERSRQLEHCRAAKSVIPWATLALTRLSRSSSSTNNSASAS